ncbi:mitochondrial protein C2orf69 homolog [Anopheles ziemanni]|uniref:mitochondrial protein C2orf69 homolog n=1 Tax=Anopheles coustani TaxID=139045 RepID=UPI002658087C|nr:mitochondrial protein C2orf69 homolog [Anopheles coustani]XP_058175537.1 mitochondrial protein C2orf69 homolog [Anopheles ziemanni]
MSNIRCNEPPATATTSLAGKDTDGDTGPSIAQFQPQPQQQQQQPQQLATAAGAPVDTSKGNPCRINGVKGYQNRTNSIIYCPPLLRTNPQKDKCSAIIYFGGDVQDIPEKMESNRDNKNYIKWNLENTALLLRESFPQSHIIVVRPMRMEYSTFSCFDNFVRGNNAGIPDHTPMHFSLQHLEELLINLTKKLTKPILDQEFLHKLLAASSSKSLASDMSCKQSNNVDLLQSDIYDSAGGDSTNESDLTDLLWWRENLNLDKASLKLIGFSKGCVVLNQFIYEFHYYKTLTPDDSTMMRLVSRITDMYWLDGGHGGGKNTWITSRSLLETLCRLCINVHVHVTPYQIQDDHRPWIRKEEKAFTDLLKRLGASFDRHLYPSEANSTNLYTHFDVLNRFRQHQMNIFTQQLHQTSQQPIVQHTAPGAYRSDAAPDVTDNREYAPDESALHKDAMETEEAGDDAPPSESALQEIEHDADMHDN